MNYGSIKYADCANGPGMRVSVFVSGCRNHCPGCFQPETWDFEYGERFTLKTLCAISDELEKPFYDGISILGGDPLEPENENCVFALAVQAKKHRKTVWIYTGYTWERIMGMKWHQIHGGATDLLLRYTDVLVDGPFIEAEKDITLDFRGSRNQRLINVPESLRKGHAVLWEGE